MDIHCTARLPNGTPVFVEVSMREVYEMPDTLILAIEDRDGELIAHEVSICVLEDIVPED